MTPTSTMDQYLNQKDELLDIVRRARGAFQRMTDVPGITTARMDEWLSICHTLETHLEEDLLRVAVVGAIKSGKSTFTNSLFRGDYLKRGAGVVTSIVTRIRCGKQLRATLFFKSWDDINADIQQALVLFPTQEWRNEELPFDIRRKSDREGLTQALETLGADQLIMDGQRNINSVLLGLYAAGYPAVKDIMPEDAFTIEFSGERFAEHRRFVSDDTLAVYLKDIELEIQTGEIDETIEIADCQGSDSPNPLHLAMIQEYLQVANLIVYVISSRTGLRQADIRFLSMIKKMGIIDQILFVVNSDLSEHESLQGLQQLLEKVRDDLRVIKPDAQVFAFSALVNLFEQLTEELSPKDRQRLDHWKNEEDLLHFSRDQSTAFTHVFRDIMEQKRIALLLRNPLERLDVMARGGSHWGRTHCDVLKKDADGAAEIIERMRRFQSRMGKIKEMTQSTLQGATARIKQDQRRHIDRFFEYGQSGVFDRTVAFVEQFDVRLDTYAERIANTGFSATLYSIFQAFRQALESFLTETIQPEIVQFLKSCEEEILQALKEVVMPYEAMTAEAVAEYTLAAESPGALSGGASSGTVLDFDIGGVKKRLELVVPSAGTTIRYSARIRTESVLRLGFYKTLKLLKRVLKKPVRNPIETELSALGDGVRGMKRETLHTVRFHFKSYRENIKFQYLFKLVDAIADTLHQVLMERLDAYDTDLNQLLEMVSDRDSDRSVTIDRLNRFVREMEQIGRDIEQFRGRFLDSGASVGGSDHT